MKYPPVQLLDRFLVLDVIFFASNSHFKEPSFIHRFFTSYSSGILKTSWASTLTSKLFFSFLFAQRSGRHKTIEYVTFQNESGRNYKLSKVISFTSTCICLPFCCCYLLFLGLWWCWLEDGTSRHQVFYVLPQNLVLWLQFQIFFLYRVNTLW